MLSWVHTRRIAALALVTLLAGCDELDYVKSPPRQVVVKADSSANIQAIERILSARFHQYLPSYFSSIKTAINNDQITFTFERGAPAASVVEYLVSNRGHLVVSSEDGRVWLTEEDVTDAGASPALSDDYNGLHLTVNPTAAARMQRLAETSQGKLVRISLDDRLVAEPKVGGPLSNRLRIPTKKQIPELLLMATLLRSGPLPSNASIIRTDLQ